MSKIVACIIARTNSTRLPQKVLKKIGNYSLIEYLISKIKKAELVDEIYLCTSVDEKDKILLDIATKCGIKSYAGSRDSVIDRMLDVAKISKATDVIRITGDNIFTDEIYLDIMIKNHLKKKVDYTRTEKLPIGITGEVIKVSALKKCYSLIDPNESQYLMLYMFQPAFFKCLVIIPEKRHIKPNYNLTVDTPEDFERTLQIANGKILDLDEILNICNKITPKYLSYHSQGIIKFPANLRVYFQTYRCEMDKRIEQSIVLNTKKGEYLLVKGKQND